MARLQEQLQKERDLRAALEAGLKSSEGGLLLSSSINQKVSLSTHLSSASRIYINIYWLAFIKRSKQSLKILQQQRQMLLIWGRRLMISHYNLINMPNKSVVWWVTGGRKYFPLFILPPPASPCTCLSRNSFLNFIVWLGGQLQFLVKIIEKIVATHSKYLELKTWRCFLWIDCIFL